MRSGKPRFVTGTPGCSGPRSKDPSPQLSSECEICVVGSYVFAIFRRLALHLQPRTEPTPVETVAPPSTCALRKCEARQPATKGTARGLFAKRGRRLRSKRRERLFRPGRRLRYKRRQAGKQEGRDASLDPELAFQLSLLVSFPYVIALVKELFPLGYAKFALYYASLKVEL